MSITIPTQTEEYGKSAAEDQLSGVNRPEQKKKKAMEQLQRVGQNSISDEVVVPDKVAKAEPSTDRFIRSDSSETNPAGTYRLEKDRNGIAKIVYDKPASGPGLADGDTDTKGRMDKTSGKKENPLVSIKNSENKPDKAPGDSPSNKGDGLQCTVDTDKVDAEIKNLKKEKQQIEQEIQQTEGDDAKKAELEERLKEIDDELRTKDTDAYRKQHATYTYKSLQK